MRMLVEIRIPHEPFNSYTREGTAGQKIGNILEATQPEAIYFTEVEGSRCAIAVYQLKADSDVPKIAEPWYLTFNADCRFRVAMTPDDLRKAGLDDLGKKWA